MGEANKPEASNRLQVVAPLMDQWPQVESCLECSAKTLQFVQDVFFYAVKVGPSIDLLLMKLSVRPGMHPAALSCASKPWATARQRRLV